MGIIVMKADNDSGVSAVRCSLILSSEIKQTSHEVLNFEDCVDVLF